MAKEFQITGWCNPEFHYMADISNKLAQVMLMVEGGRYFIINRPRQYGKTTMLEHLATRLRESGDYLVFNISFEDVGDAVFENEGGFSKMFLDSLAIEMNAWGEPELAAFLETEIRKSPQLNELSKAITALALKTTKKLVLLIDEVDKSSNNQLFLSFLGVLRKKFLKRHMAHEKSFHAVVLAGVHDVKSLKLKIRPEAEAKYNSPWNIGTEFKVDMSLQPQEIVPMLEEYSAEKGVKMEASAIAEKLVYYTSGYPFLVSSLCKMLDEDILPAKTENSWTLEDLALAVNTLTKETNTNFDTLAKNLENNPALYEMASNIMLEGEQVEYSILDPTVNLGVLYGIFRNGQGIRIHNRVYEEIIFNYMTSRVKREILMGGHNFRDNFILPGNRLDMPKVLDKFQVFMKEQYSKKDRDFLERHGRLIFLAFLKPIINGGGHEFKEVQLSEEKRIDVAVTFFQHKYVVELKIWYGEAAHNKGLSQLADYLDSQHLPEGCLLIFDRSEKKSWRQQWLEVPAEAGRKKIYAVWV